jgi:hypothetical protein
VNPVWQATAHQALAELEIALTSPQEQLFWSPARLKIGMGGERGGKSYVGATYLTSRHLMGSLYWIVSWDYQLARVEFDYIADQLTKLGNLDPKKYSRPKEGPCALETKTGQLIETKSGQDPTRIAGWAPDGILGCEIAHWPLELFRRVYGRLSEKNGWFLGTGSFESSLGWLPEQFIHWQGPNEDGGAAFSLPSHSNQHIYPGGWDDPKIVALRAFYPEARFKERFLGEPCPPAGRVFSEARVELHVSPDSAYVPGRPVYLAIDPGWGSAYAVLALQMNDVSQKWADVKAIGEVYAQNRTHSEVIADCQARYWWKDVQYGVMDIAGRQHHADRAATEVWQEEGRINIFDNYVTVQDGIDRVRTFLRVDPSTGRPRLTIGSQCTGLLSEMGLAPSPVEGGGIYSYKTDAQGVVVSDTPHDRYNHSCKALAYFLTHEFGHVNRRSVEPISYLDYDDRASIRMRTAGGQTYLENMSGL